MRKTTVITAVLVAAVIIPVSCADEQLVDSREQQRQQYDELLASGNAVVTFSPLVNHGVLAGGTRSVDIAIRDSLFEFDVWGIADSTNHVRGVDTTYYVMGTSPTDSYLIYEGVEDVLKDRYNTEGVSYNEVLEQARKAGLTLWGYKDIVTWPRNSNTIRFYALAANGKANKRTSAKVPYLTPNINCDTVPSIVYTAPETIVSGSIDDGNLVTSHAEQRDLLVAGRSVDVYEVNHISVENQVWMNVHLTFGHALSQLTFDAKLLAGYPDLKITVHSITLCNLYRTATGYIATNGAMNWQAEDAPITRDAYTVMTPGADGNGVVLQTTTGQDGNVLQTVALSSGTDAWNSDNLMVIPQDIHPWVPTRDPQPERQRQAYLKIRCDATQHGFNLLKEKYVYVPLSFNNGSGEWKPGHVYRYHLTFGLGRDSSGRLNGNDITFTVSVGNSWTTGTVADPQL